MKILSKRQILMLHAALAARAGSLDGLRDEGLLDSAIHAPMQTFGGQELYPSTLEKAARLGYGLIRNHPFADGNKRIGITFAELPDSLGMHLNMSVRTAVNYARLVWSSVGMLVSGQVGVDQLSGPVGVAEVMADTAKYSMISFFQLVAFISINLGVMNLLPLPALDGGRLVFLIIEGIRRKPVPPRYEGYVHAAGLMLLLMLMVYVTGQDVLRIFMRSN